MHTVGADQRVAAHGGAAFELQRDAIVVLREAAAARAQMQRIGFGTRDGLRQDGEEVGTEDGEVRGAVALDRYRTEVEELPGLARLPVADLLALRLARQRLELVADPERLQHARAVRGELHARADLLQLRRLLVDIDVDAVL